MEHAGAAAVAATAAATAATAATAAAAAAAAATAAAAAAAAATPVQLAVIVEGRGPHRGGVARASPRSADTRRVRPVPPPARPPPGRHGRPAEGASNEARKIIPPPVGDDRVPIGRPHALAC